MVQQAEKHTFQAEVNEVLSIVVNSLYSNREVFLRELISNASDAQDKLEFKSLTDHELKKNAGEPRIELIPDPEAKTLTVRDFGVGMSKDELVGNLGTIARSGSKALMKSLQESQAKEGDKKLSLIGQFGVGFYSAFLVADRVTVTSRAAGSDEAWRWQSEAKGEFTVEPAERDEPGTDLVLHLKEDAEEYLQEWPVRELVRKYSDYVRYPIRMEVETSTTEGEGDDAKTVTTKEWKTLNEARALWTRPKSEVTEEQYNEFYKHLAHDWDKPLAHTHFKVEGTQELTGLLFVPKKAPFDMFERKSRGVRLFVKRVFIMDDAEALLPEWLRFIKGVIDSEDLPLNVSRELLQEDASTRFIRKQIVSRTLTMLEELAAQEPEKAEGDKAAPTHPYLTFWSEFGRVLKEGVHYDQANRERIAKLLRFESSHSDELTSLEDYVARMTSDQKSIFYVTADSIRTARQSPHIEALKSRGYEVLFMGETIDEWVVEALREFDGKELVSAAKGALDLPETEEEKKQKEEHEAAFKGLVEKVKEGLGGRVADVRLTNRLTDSPACLVGAEHSMSPHMERVLRANGQPVPEQKRILELNPDHAVVKKLQAMAQGDSAEIADWSGLLFDQAMIAEGLLPADPAGFAKALTRLMAK